MTVHRRPGMHSVDHAGLGLRASAGIKGACHPIKLRAPCFIRNIVQTEHSRYLYLSLMLWLGGVISPSTFCKYSPSPAMHERAGGTSRYPWELQERKGDPRDQHLGPISSPLLCLLYKVLVFERALPATKTYGTRLPTAWLGRQWNHKRVEGRKSLLNEKENGNPSSQVVRCRTDISTHPHPHSHPCPVSLLQLQEQSSFCRGCTLPLGS